jgi:hypothetical protein
VLAAFLRCHRHVTRCAAKGQCPSASNIIIVIADGQGCLIRLVSRERKKAPVGLAAASGSFFFLEVVSGRAISSTVVTRKSHVAWSTNHACD